MVKKAHGFTIVELLIVIVIIAILAAISVIAYTGIQNRALESALKSDLRNGATQLGLAKAQDGVYPVSGSGLQKSTDISFVYSREDDTYCLSATTAKSSTLKFYITSDNASPRDGVCPVGDGAIMQEITAANCPTSKRIWAVDARDSHTYWVQKLADGKCWMLTNIGYAGGGTNTYGDTKALQNGMGDTESTYTVAKYYVPAGANVTMEPVAPSTSTTGIGQYGYLYNWCAAMGGQETAACAYTATPTPNSSVSICPAGWRLPIGGSGGEYEGLNTAINSGSVSNDTGLLAVWLAQRGGRWSSSDNGFVLQGNIGYYWSATQVSFAYAYSLYFSSTVANPARADVNKNVGYALRCVAS